MLKSQCPKGRFIASIFFNASFANEQTQRKLKEGNMFEEQMNLILKKTRKSCCRHYHTLSALNSVEINFFLIISKIRHI